MTTALKEEIRKIARASVREELMRARASVLPLVSAGEQREIEKRYRQPSRRGVRTLRVRI